MKDIEKKVRPNLFEMVPYSPGKPIAEVQREFGLDTIVKIASNENPLGASNLVKQRITEALSELHRYPDGAQYELKQALSKKLNVNPNMLLIGNGSDEIIKMLCETFLLSGDQLLFPTPSFSEYEFGGRLMDAELTAIPLLEEFQYDLNLFEEAITDRTKLIFLCSPNNPTGTYIPFAELKAFLDRIPREIIVIVDEAYIEFAGEDDCRSSIGLVHEGYPIICMRTFSKAYGLAALRVGYCVASQSIIEYVNRTREPFNVNHLAQIAAIAALEDEAHLHRSVSTNSSERTRLTNELASLGMRVIPSQTNFILFDTGRPSKPLFDELLQRGIIVRVGFGLPTYIRLSIGTAEENDAFLREFKPLIERAQ